MRSLITILLILPMALPGLRLQAQDSPLDAYLQQGLENNITLQQKSISVDQALSALRESKGLFMPKVQLNAGYTSGYGGRSISFPIGDLLNPVYSTLNQLTQSNGFPQVENVNQNFFPENFYDVKLHTTVPIWNAPIQENRDLRKQQLGLQEVDTDIYRRELVRSISVAYFHYCQSLVGIKVYNEAIGLASEAQRMNQRLLDNGAGLPAYVLRSKSEVDLLEAQLLEAEAQSKSAARYFNFLINQPLDGPIDTTGATAPVQARTTVTQFDGVEAREELLALRKAVDLNQQLVQLNKSQLQPTLGGFVDLGMQAENFKVDKDAPYILFGVQLDVPIFAGFSNSEKIIRSQQEVQRANLQVDLVRQQLQMQARMAADQLSTAIRNHEAAVARKSAAATYQQLIDRAFREGSSSFIETIDARNQYILAAQQLNIAAFNIRIAEAELEYALAEAPIH